MDDFMAALQEVPPAFGVSETELKQCVQNHIIPFAPHVEVMKALSGEKYYMSHA